MHTASGHPRWQSGHQGHRWRGHLPTSPRARPAPGSSALWAELSPTTVALPATAAAATAAATSKQEPGEETTLRTRP